MEQQAQETAELQALLASEPYAGEFAGPEVWAEEDHSHKTLEEWEKEVLGFKQADALAWADALLAETKAFEMSEQVADENGEKRDNELHQGCKSVDLGNNRRKLVSHRMAMHDAGAEYGIFVDVQAAKRAIKLTAIRVAAHGLSNNVSAWEPRELNFDVQARLEAKSDPMSVTVYTCEGTSAGKELNASAWKQIGSEDNVTLPRINGKEDWEGQWREQWRDEPGDTTFVKGEWIYPERQEPIYQSVPLDTELTLQAGERRGFLIHTNCKVGIANRWPIGRGFVVGQKTDSDEYLQLFAMRAQPEEQPFTEEVYEAWVHPCTGERAETPVARRRQIGHAFVGEFEYEVLEGQGESGKVGVCQREDDSRKAISGVPGREGKHSRKHKRRPLRSQAGAEQSGASDGLNLDELLTMQQRIQNVLDEDVRAVGDATAASGQTEGAGLKKTRDKKNGSL